MVAARLMGDLFKRSSPLRVIGRMPMSRWIELSSTQTAAFRPVTEAGFNETGRWPDRVRELNEDMAGR